MSRTVTKPPDDRQMWRMFLKLAHRDTGGSDELFIWARELQEVVCSGRLQTERPQLAPPREPRREQSSEPGRVPFNRADFADLTRRAVELADEVDTRYARILLMLRNCRPSPAHQVQERRGASYKMLAAIGHEDGMNKRERSAWYRIAETIPLADRHAGHILSRLKARG